MHQKIWLEKADRAGSYAVTFFRTRLSFVPKDPLIPSYLGIFPSNVNSLTQIKPLKPSVLGLQIKANIKWRTQKYLHPLARSEVDS